MKIFRFVKKVFFLGLTILSNFTKITLLSATPLNCVSMKNQECKSRPQIVNVDSNNPIFYPFRIKISKSSGNCTNINNPYATICVRDIIKSLNVKVFNLMSGTNETRFTEWYETFKSEYRLNAVICNNKQRWSENKCRCECKELINKGTSDKGFIWIYLFPSIVNLNVMKIVILVNI